MSALGNAIAFNTALGPFAAVRALNAKLSRVWAWAVSQVPPDFNPRRALERWYRYELSPAHEIENLQSALSLFQGEHDFRNFTRDRTRTVLRIDEAIAIQEDDLIRSLSDLDNREFVKLYARETRRVADVQGIVSQHGGYRSDSHSRWLMGFERGLTRGRVR